MRRPEFNQTQLLLQIFCSGDLVCKFLNIFFLVFTSPDEIIVNQIDFHQFGVGEFHTIDCGSLVRCIDWSQCLSFRGQRPVKLQLGSLYMLGTIDNAHAADFITSAFLRESQLERELVILNFINNIV